MEQQAPYYRSFLSVSDLSPQQLEFIMTLALEMKAVPEKFENALTKRKLALIFQKTSTRTKESFLVGAYELGMFAGYIDWKTSNFTLSALEDEIRVLSMWYDVIMARVHRHEDLLVMAQFSQVPIINGLSELHHPCQALADILTIREEFGRDLSQIRLAYVGDGNNVCNSLVQVAALAGIKSITLAIPPYAQYQPLSEVLDYARGRGANIRVLDNAPEAVKEADVVYTDTWVSMGDEHETAERLVHFRPYQVNSALMTLASPRCIFLHDMPAHLGDEVTAEVFRGPTSRVFKQADNRKHAQKALMHCLLKEFKS